MNKFKLYFYLLAFSFSFFSCEKDEPIIPAVPPRDYATQYNTEILDIEGYLNTHYIEKIVQNPGNTNDQDITFAKIDNGQASILSLENATTYPKLFYRDVILHGLKYKIYYLVIRPGVGDSPCNVDEVFAAYKGTYLSRTATTANPPSEVVATLFEENKFPSSGFNLSNVIKGWSEIFPKFKSGTSSVVNGKVVFSDFGAGVMFLPSALCYYNRGTNSIPAYAPLIFSIKLFEVKRIDSDNDGVPSFQEDSNNDGYLYDYRNTFFYPASSKEVVIEKDKDTDPDADDIPDFLDIDDDGDGHTTFNEIKRPNIIKNNVSMSNGVYPFHGAVREGKPYDNPDTEYINESEGIPAFVNGKLDHFTPTRIRVHLDKNYPVK